MEIFEVCARLNTMGGTSSAEAQVSITIPDVGDCYIVAVDGHDGFGRGYFVSEQDYFENGNDVKTLEQFCDIPWSERDPDIEPGNNDPAHDPWKTGLEEAEAAGSKFLKYYRMADQLLNMVGWDD